MKVRRNEVMNYVRIFISNSKALGDGIKLKDIQNFCEKEEITINEVEIENFLKQKAQEAGVNINKAVDLDCITLTGDKEKNEKLVNRSVERIMECLKRERYTFNSIDLKYFKDLFKIYRSKALKLCEVLEMMAGRIEVDKQLFKELDIWYNCDFVNLEDVDRILKPLVYNYCKAYEVQAKANNLNTYLTKTLNEYAMAQDGVSYSECLPYKELQYKRKILLFGPSETEQYVELTEKQKQKIEKDYKKNMEEVSKVFASIMND